MTKTFRLLLVLIGVLLFAVGLLLGERIRSSKFEKYLRPTTVAPMDLALLRANLDMVRKNTSLEVPTVYFDSSCGCFVGQATITDGLMKQPLDQVRAKLMAIAYIARESLRFEFPELSKTELGPKAGAAPIPDRDFKMTFFELNLQEPDKSMDVAEYVDGKIVFK